MTGAESARLRLSGPTACALVDQAVVSGGNILVSVVVGRAMGVDSLGAYTLLFTVMVFANSAIDATLSSSFMMRRPELRWDELPRYAGANMVLAGGLIIVSGVGISAGVVLAGGTEGAALGSVWPLVFGGVAAFLLREHLRRFDFAARRMASALRLDLAAYGAQAVATASIALVQGLDLRAVFFGLAIGQGGAVAVGIALRAGQFELRGLPLRRVAADIVHLSRWVLAAHILLIIGLQMMPWLVTHQLGYAAAGSYAAAMALSNLANPMLTGFINAMLPAGAAAYSRGPAAVRSALAGGVLALSCTTAAISLTTAVFARDFLYLVFGPEFVAEAPLLQVLAASFLVRSLDVGPYVGCWALRRPDQNVTGNIVVIVLGAGLSLALMPGLGVMGAGLGLLFANAVTVALRWWNFLRLTRQGGPLQAAPSAVAPFPAKKGAAR